jgi:hypothetical protein
MENKTGKLFGGKRKYGKIGRGSRVEGAEEEGGGEVGGEMRERLRRREVHSSVLQFCCFGARYRFAIFRFIASERSSCGTFRELSHGGGGFPSVQSHAPP